MKLHNPVASFALVVFAVVAGYYWSHDNETQLGADLLKVMDGTGTGIISVDKDAQILAVNDNMVKLSGRTHVELCTMNLLDLMAPHEGDAKHPRSFAKFDKPIVTRFSCRLLTKDGVAVPINVMARVADGRFIAVIDRSDALVDHVRVSAKP